MQKKIIKNIIEAAQNTIKIEAQTVANLVNKIDENFAEIVELIANNKGRVVVTGIGKSANIGLKIVASLNSTGTPSIFMHAADAIHGDLGIIQQEDIVICISKSGNTPEIKVLIPLIKANKNKVIAIVSDLNSFLAKSSDYILHAEIEKEASPDNLVPTSSTTAQLVLGDALTIALLKYKGFTPEDFAKLHPGGSIGKKLYLRVEDIYILNEAPRVFPDDDIKRIISEITSKRLGATAVVDEKNNLLGIITDGDLRRTMETKLNIINKIRAKDIMSKSPKTIADNELALKALKIIRENNITQVIVTKESKYIGMIHLHDLIREGIV